MVTGTQRAPLRFIAEVAGAAALVVAPFTTANTTEWRVGLGVEVPVWGKLILGSLVQYRNANSNVAAFSYRDLSISAGPMIRF